jgi:hypothetical protein
MLKEWVKSPLSDDLGEFASRIVKLDGRTPISQAPYVHLPTTQASNEVELPAEHRTCIASLVGISEKFVPSRATSLKKIYIGDQLFQPVKHAHGIGNSRLLYAAYTTNETSGEDGHALETDEHHGIPQISKFTAELRAVYPISFHSSSGEHCTKVFLVVHNYEKFSTTKHDGLQETEVLGLCFLRPTPTEVATVILADDVISHVAQLHIINDEENYLISIGVDRVRIYIWIIYYETQQVCRVNESSKLL